MACLVARWKTHSFHSDRDGYFEIYTMTGTGGELPRLTDDPAAEYDPDRSPDGARIAYTSDRSGNREICIKNTAGKSVFNLTNHPANWLPPGSQLAGDSGATPASDRGLRALLDLEPSCCWTSQLPTRTPHRA